MTKVRDFLTKALTTFFFLGHFPYMAGTFVSFLCLFFIWFLRSNIYFYFLISIIVGVLGFIFSGKAEKLFGRKDCRYIVIDEVWGIFISFLFAPITLKSLFWGFLVFRLFDGLKPFPICLVERFDGAKGIMLDDLVAGFYTNLLLQLVFRFLV